MGQHTPLQAGGAAKPFPSTLTNPLSGEVEVDDSCCAPCWWALLPLLLLWEDGVGGRVVVSVVLFCVVVPEVCVLCVVVVGDE